MNRRLNLLIPILFLFILSLSCTCGLFSQEGDEPAASEAQEPAAEVSDPSREATERAQLASDTATEQAAEVVVDLAATETQQAIEEEEAAAAEAEAAVAAQAERMQLVVEDLVDQGHLTSADGTYAPISDFNETFAQLGWYQWWETGYAPTNFILRADAAWESASDTADWATAGCGFVFRLNPQGDHFLAFLAMDGSNVLARTEGEAFSMLGSAFARQVDTPADSAEIMLLVNGRTISFYVDGQRVQTRQGAGLEEGALALTLLSGTNKDYGTRCIMENIDLWELDS